VYPDKKIYVDRGPAESLFYKTMAEAAGEDAVIVETPCADALYIRGFAGLDAGQLEQAEEYIKRAIAMSPANSLYLSELGHIYHFKREWQQALDVFRDSEKFAAAYSPPKLRKEELARAKRGVGYSLIELGKLDEAEAKYKECLEIDRNDKNALQELEYIKELRSTPPPGGGTEATPEL
jgi:tetratricopeptide (TPR) repeat protein